MDNKIDFKVGILLILSLIILALFIIFLGKFWKNNGKNIYVDYEFSGSIRKNSSVKISGMEVGYVKELKFMHGKKNKYGKNILSRLTINIDNKYFNTIKKDSLFYITTAGILGELYIEVDPGKSQESIKENDVLMGVTPPKIDLMISKVSNLIDSSYNLLNQNKDILNDIFQESFKLIKNTNNILEKNKNNIDNLFGSSNKLLDNAINLSEKFNNIVGDGKEIKSIVSNTNSITKKVDLKIEPLLDNTQKALEKTNVLLDDTKNILEKNKNNINKLVMNSLDISSKANKSLDKVNETIDKATKGDSSTAKILNSSELYNSIKELLFTLKRQPWKLMWRGE